VPDIRFEADVVFPRQRIAIAIDGCIWHGCPAHGMQPGRNRDYWREKIARNVVRDRRNDHALAEAGWLLVRIWEHEPPGDAAARIAVLVRERKRAAR
jgi:DNA mismatch endonuclease (patch repair protein)